MELRIEQMEDQPDAFAVVGPNGDLLHLYLTAEGRLEVCDSWGDPRGTVGTDGTWAALRRQW